MNKLKKKERMNIEIGLAIQLFLLAKYQQASTTLDDLISELEPEDEE